MSDHAASPPASGRGGGRWSDRGEELAQAPAEGARLWAERGDGSVAPMGGEWGAQPAVLRLRLPGAADIEVLRDGSLWHGAHGDRLDLDVEEPGVYRVEARVGGRLWLLSNSVHLR